MMPAVGEGFAVAENGRIVVARGVDVAIPWWSFTKTVLPAAALVLVRDGCLALDAPMPGRPFTLRQLLQHRAGIADYGGLTAYHAAVDRGDDAWPLPALLQATQAERLRSPPGQAFAYSNIGYVLVRQAIERVTSVDLGTALRRLVLDPLGISDACLVTARTATPVPGIRPRYDAGWVYHGLLVGPLRSAVLLLHRLLRGDLLPAPLLAQMVDGQDVGDAAPDRPWSRPAYGLGLMCGETRMGRVAGHTGGGPDSVIAIYNGARTAGTFAVRGDVGGIEKAAIEAALR
jgi:CubicO group peptidase (beta-lactamase class C family)